jgi:hypothetical protein
LDAALLKELRDLEKHAATELGQWTEKQDVTGVMATLTLDEALQAVRELADWRTRREEAACQPKQPNN